MKWDGDIRFLKGVGPRRAALFARLDIQTAGELLCACPRAYVDYSKPVPVAAAPYDTPCAVRAEVLSKDAPLRVKGGRSLFKVYCADASAALELIFFNNPYGVKKLEVGAEYLFYGKVGGGFAARELIAPSFIPAGATAPLVPVYSLCAGLSNHTVAALVQVALSAVEDIPEPLPARLLQKYRLPERGAALRMIHRPAAAAEAEVARRRLAFEELFCLQLGLLLLRGRGGGFTGAPMRPVAMTPFERALPFALTGAQKRAIGEITAGMAGKNAMNRLLQGDVGSGKTAVAAAGIYMAAQNGYQSVLMAPTELLARQHAETLERLLGPLGVTSALLTGGAAGKAKRQTLNAIAEGKAQLVVGTHAVLSAPVRFLRLGFAVTDEQHRFGVRQRGLLARKAARPHLLVMSATPIPRTLALLWFGDLDVSVLDELPPGRPPVKTRLVPAEKRADMFRFLSREIAAGRQAYIVCPLIGQDGPESPDWPDGEKAPPGGAPGELQTAAAYLDEVVRPLLPGVSAALLHGRMKAGEKAETMRAFKAGEVKVLVATTVIEVGLDVPNAAVMVVEDAERYGLSALHQLRGRVGRGAAESWCFLVSGHAGAAARERLQKLASTRDGFAVAEYDLAARGPGDFFGSRQHGLPVLRAAGLSADTRMLEAARKEAAALLQEDPKLAAPENAQLALAVRRLFGRAGRMN